MLPGKLRRRPSRAAAAGFAVGLALTVGGVIGGALAASQGSDAPPSASPTPFVPANPAPALPGLAALSASDVPLGGLTIGDLRVLQAGKTPNYSYHDHPAAGETFMRVDSGDGLPDAARRLTIPDGPGWTATRGGAEIAVGADASVRVLLEGADIHPAGGKFDWQLASGTLAAGTKFEDSMMSRDSANFTYTADGVTAFVFDASPAASVDRAWHVRLVVGGRWVALDAPVVEFSTVAGFVQALVEANR